MLVAAGDRASPSRIKTLAWFEDIQWDRLRTGASVTDLHSCTCSLTFSFLRSHRRLRPSAFRPTRTFLVRLVRPLALDLDGPILRLHVLLLVAGPVDPAPVTSHDERRAVGGERVLDRARLRRPDDLADARRLHATALSEPLQSRCTSRRRPRRRRAARSGRPPSPSSLSGLLDARPPSLPARAPLRAPSGRHDAWQQRWNLERALAPRRERHGRVARDAGARLDRRSVGQEGDGGGRACICECASRRAERGGEGADEPSSGTGGGTRRWRRRRGRHARAQDQRAAAAAGRRCR